MFTSVESTERIVLPDISIVPNVEVVPVFTKLAAVTVPVVVKFSSPNDMVPFESVIEPFVIDSVPVERLGAVRDVVTETAFGNPIVNVSVALTTASFTFSDNEFIAGTVATASFTVSDTRQYVAATNAVANFRVSGANVPETRASGSFQLHGIHQAATQRHDGQRE